MTPEEIAVKSAIDKPLHELTEDDIAQTTREECRRYLFEKGMRRPSWNKSQAIQQVIMLKTLLETTPDCESQKRIRFSRPNSYIIPESVVSKGTRNDVDDSMSVGESEPYCRKDLDKHDSGITGLPSIPIGQMAIFYCGKVNVYDDLPEDKARSILNIAASPVQIQERTVDGSMVTQPLPRLSKAFGAKAHPDSEPTVQKVEGSSTRKALVQRYLDKKKERFKSKRKAGISSCTSLDMYFNHQIPDEPLSRSNTCSPLPQIRPPSTLNRCSSVFNDSLKNVSASSDIIN